MGLFLDSSPWMRWDCTLGVHNPRTWFSSSSALRPSIYYCSSRNDHSTGILSNARFFSLIHLIMTQKRELPSLQVPHSSGNSKGNAIELAGMSDALIRHAVHALGRT